MSLLANNETPSSIGPPVPSDEIAGNVFNDVNFNGEIDGEMGVEGITVNLYDGSAMPVSTTTTNFNGDYSFSGLDETTTYRVEFVIPSMSALTVTPTGIDNGSAVQFVTPGNSASLGLGDINFFCTENPLIVTTCYIKGLANGEAIVTNNYNLDGATAYPCDAAQVGSTFGLAYQRSTEIMYSAAFVKSKVGLGSEGIDAIYMIDPNGGCFKDPANTHFNLSDFGCDAGTTPPICATSPSDDPTCRDLVIDPGSPTYDTWGWNNTFKTGLGDIDISSDGNTLYVMNLEARELVILDVSDPNNVSLINKVAVPNPGCGGANDYRPFATKVYEGQVYIGITCTAESSQMKSDLKAYVYVLNGAGTGFGQVPIDGTTSGAGASDHIRLDYDRSGAFDAAFFADGDFQPWTDNPADYDIVNTYLTRPMPLLTDIEFDNDGSMMLAFGNRDAYTVGEADIYPGGPDVPNTPPLGPLVAGELLRVCNTGSGYVLEGGTACGSNMSGGDNLGPGGGEFYWGESAAGIHFETTMGALAMLPGSDRLIMTFMDAGGLNTGGLHTLSNTTGSKLPFAGSAGLQLYANGPGEFSKGSGLGDLEIVCPLPLIQVGNRVWFDTNGDGIQDPDEDPAVGFTVKIYSKPATGAPVFLESTTTGTDGSYYFPVDPGTDYFLVFCGDSNDGGTVTFGGTEYTATLTDQGASDALDSDATIQDVAGVLVPAICINSGSLTNHTYDFGLVESAVPPASVGNYTFLDCNENGIQDMGDSPLANVPVTITGTEGTFMTTSNDEGFYEFTELVPGDYTISFGFPAGITGLMYTTQDVGGNDVIDSDADANGDTETITLESGVNNENVDAGYKDIEAPTFGIMAMNMQVECDGAGNTAALNAWLASYGGATATDNLSIVSNLVWANNFTALSNDCGATGSAIVEFTVTDECGNTATTTATFTIVDSTPPAMVVPAAATIECDELTAPSNTGMATATDDCSTNPPVITFSDASTQGMGCSAYSYTITRTWMATDDCGNSSQATQIITVQDNNPPMILVPVNVTVECDQPTDPGATGNAVALNDNCAPDSELTVTYVDVSTQTPTGCGNDTYMITRTWTASDPCGNSTTGVQVINVVDTTPPTIFEPADITIECDESTAPSNTGSATGVDNCSTGLNEVVITFSDVSTQTMSGCGQYNYTISRTWVATDACGNSSTALQTIEVEDTTPPEITPPADITIECDESTDPSNTGFATSSGDNCASSDEITITYSDVSTQGMGCGAYSYIIIRTWTATDICNNSSQASQTITVQDNNPPTITVPADVTVECDQPTDPGATGNAVASNDNCALDSELTVTYVDVSTQTPTGCGNDTYMITRTWTASDPCGNTATDVQIINVEDTTPPTIFGPADITIECDESTDPSNTGSASGVDNCTTGLDEVVITFSDVSTQTMTGCGQYNYTITRTWVATDACGNSSSTLQTIEVEDTTPPEITCPANIIVECDESTDPSNTGFASSPGDNCSSVDEILITSSDVSTQTNEGCGQYQYTITRTWVATDACGNSTTCVQTIDVTDTTAPVITCPSNVTLSCFETVPSPYMNAMDFVAGGGTVSDNCTATLPEFTVFAINDDNGGSNCPGDARVVVRTYYVSDACGNISTCTQTFTYLASSVGPVITSVLPECYKYCADQANPMETDITYDTDCSFGATVSITGPVVIGQENCPGSISRYTYTVTDDCGRTSTPVTRDFIIGNDGPTITCPAFNLILDCGDPNNAGYIADHIGTVSANTSCELGYTINHFPQNFNNIACASATVVTFVVTDDCGRSASCTTTISIIDDTPPAFTAVPPSVCDEIDCSADLNYWFNHWIDYMENGLEAEDACDSNVSINAINTNLNTDCGSSTVVTFVATDNCGNESEITGTFTVLEEQASSLSGLVVNEAGDRIGEVSVSLEGSNFTAQTLTDEEGAYAFNDLAIGENYNLRPQLVIDPLNGISSFDLYLMAKHILEEELLDTPYKMIAADVNKSGSVTTADLLELRRLILHNIDDFQTNDSWSFVAADYVFADPNNPFASLFPEEVLINGLSANEIHDFIGIKVGDVNGTATTNGLQEGDSRNFKGDLALALKDQDIEEGKTYEVSFRSSQFIEMVGYQFSLNFDTDLLEYQGLRADGLTNLSAANFGLSKLGEGVITTSWHNKSAVTIMDETDLFTLRFTAKSNGLLSEALRISSEYTLAEAYGKLAETNAIELLKVDLRFDGTALAADRYILHQNNPNPFHDQTLIGFNLPEASTATLNIYNVKGELVKAVSGDFEKGYHSIEIDRSDLGVTGLFYYRLVTPKWNQTKKMTLIKW